MRALGRRLVRWKAVVILLVVLGIIFYVVMAQSRQRLDALSTRNEQLQQQYAACLLYTSPSPRD